jgi:hypothetical protein
MAGVNRAAVAVTDTFDVWRVRTNELNTSLNAGTHAKTADTIVWRDDNASFVANTVTANTVTLARAADTPTININSQLAGTSSTGSIVTNGGIKVDMSSHFGGTLNVAGIFTASGSSVLGDSNTLDTITMTGRVASTIDVATSITYDIGDASRLWRNYYGQGMNLTANTTIAADSTLKITSGHFTKPSLKITDVVAAGSTSTLVNINSNSPDTAARDIAIITNDNLAAVGATALHLKSDAGRGLQITSTLGTSKPSLEITSSHTTANASIITASALTTGSAVQVTSAGSSRTGHMIHLASTDTGAGSTGDVLHVKASTSSNTAMIANFANATTNVLSVMVGGGVRIDGDLDVTGSTTQFRTSTALVNDKTLVLGSVGDAVTGVTFTQHASAPVFTTTANHGLSVDDVIFIATSSSSVITSETLYTVATVPSATTFTVTGTNNTSADASTRTVVFTGPQLDSGVDDAGIYIPGSTAIHYLKWDDDDNFFEVNDSFKVDTTTQLVVPKGTTAQQPGSLTATTAARTQGALRFNTTSSTFEGVHVSGVTAPFEAIATQNFSTAIAVALG